MTAGKRNSVAFSTAWNSFVRDLVSHADEAWRRAGTLTVWRKPDGSPLTQLDLRLDELVRTCITTHLPQASVLSEELGLLMPESGGSGQIAIVDPVDGTESLIASRDSWWVSVGIFEEGVPRGGLIYQPTSRRLHDSLQPVVHPADGLVLGMSPDRLADAALRGPLDQLARRGMQFVDTPHAAEKVAAVLEGRVSASIYLPSAKSPAWRSWDLAAGIALAAANSLELRTLDGEPLTLDDTRVERRDGWICARDVSGYDAVRRAFSE